MAAFEAEKVVVSRNDGSLFLASLVAQVSLNVM